MRLVHSLTSAVVPCPLRFVQFGDDKGWAERAAALVPPVPPAESWWVEALWPPGALPLPLPPTNF